MNVVAGRLASNVKHLASAVTGLRASSSSNGLVNQKSAMQKVHSHDHEHWVLTRSRCSCGTAYTRKSILRQSVESHEGVSVDTLTVMCLQCGTVAEFNFDVSSFFGKPNLGALDDLMGDRERVSDMYLWSELRMESLTNYLRELTKSGDALALEYIADRVRRCLDALPPRAEE
jgi:hypothetical protein